MNKLFKALFCYLLLLTIAVQAQDLQKISQEINNETKQEQARNNKSEIRKKINKIKEFSLTKWAKDNPKKAATISTFFVLEVMGLCLIHSRFGYASDRKLSIFYQALLAPVCAPYLALEGMERLCTKPLISQYLIPVIKVIKIPMESWGRFIGKLAGNY